jgi:hypothetical protein
LGFAQIPKDPGRGIDDDIVGAVAHVLVRSAAPRTADYAMLARSIDELEENARSRREQRLLQILERLVPEYRRSTPRPSAAASGG